MKKLFILLLVVCLVFAGVLSYVAYVPRPIADVDVSEEEPAYAAETVGEEVAAEESVVEEPAYQGLDYEAIFALHDKDEVVATVNGRQVTWGEYFYWLYMQASQVDSMYVYYGMAPDWNAIVSDDASLSQFCVLNAEYVLRQLDAIEALAQDNDVELTEEDLANIALQKESEKISLVGEDADDEAFYAKLEELHLPRDLYDRVLSATVLMDKGFAQIYGENGELVDAADVLAYLEENEYMSAHHILLMSIDPATGIKLDEAAIEEKRAQAQELADQLKAIEDEAERLERFNALKAELCDDTGKAAYPDGYTYTPGTMYPEFEEACLAQGAYEISDVVETGVGFHIIMTLPLDADALLFSSSGQPGTARVIYAEEDYNNDLAQRIEAMDLEYAEGFEQINLADFVSE